MKKIYLPAFAVLAALLSFTRINTLKGTWIYAGGYENGRFEGPTEGYQLQRKYTATSFEAFLVEKDSKPEKYEAGKYVLTGDSCLETETFNAQTTKSVGVTLHYRYTFRHDTLFLKGRLPSGMYVLEYWKKAR